MADVELRSQPYRVGDKVLEWGKICFRLDAWDRKHYPHTVDGSMSGPGLFGSA
jgi:hypothetical protein